MVLDYTFERQLMLERKDRLAEGYKEGFAEGRAEGRAEGMRGVIKTYKAFGADRAKTKEELQKNFDLTEEMVEEFLKLFW